MIRKTFIELAKKVDASVIKVYNNIHLKIRHDKTGHVIRISYSQLKNLSRLGKSPFKVMAKELAAIERTEELLPEELPEQVEVMYVDISDPKPKKDCGCGPKKKK